MGGAAFATAAAPGAPTLRTPRLSPADYTRLRSTLKTTLQAFFGSSTELDTLRPAPEKPDHGDIDFLVAHDDPTAVDWLALATAIGAAGLIVHHAAMCSLAVPLHPHPTDGSPGPRPPVLYKQIASHQPSPLPYHAAAGQLTKEIYAHVDIELAPPALYAWRAFHGSYGDTGSLLGRILRPLRFTITHAGLYLRMRELDEVVKKAPQLYPIADKAGLLFLSCDPGEILRFLGLATEGYEAGFTTLEALYEWVAGCRVLSLGSVRVKRDTDSERAREATRTVYAGFFNHWLPAHPPPNPPAPASSDADPDATRQQLAEEALEFFDRRAEYAIQHAALLRAIATATALRLIKDFIQQHSGRKGAALNEVVRGFQHFVGVSGEGGMVVRREAHGSEESELYKLLGEGGEGFRDEVGVGEFVKGVWEEVKTMERRRAETARAEVPAVGGT
ncbi:hypothetical protein LTR53_014978 [Teratosphaeriaceae sp. CCFEE 6253]|nr:hypothetical protein LTR53_014978 [Teratosphaeriaceae sp. CCFEE 6253]